MLDIFAEQGNGLALVIMVITLVVLSVPAVKIARSDRTLTWTTAVLLGFLLFAIGIIAIGEIPSRMLYWFDANHEALAGNIPIGPIADMMAGKDYFILRDIVVNGVQTTLFIVLVAAVYFWGERHRREGRFGS